MIMKICDMYQILRTKIMQSFYNGYKICEHSEINKRNKMTIHVLTKKKTINKAKHENIKPFCFSENEDQFFFH